MESKKIGIWSILCFMGMSLSLMGQTNFRGKVLDAETKTPIIGAKIGVSGQGIGVLTNDIGYFVYTKYHQVLDGSNVLEISAPGKQREKSSIKSPCIGMCLPLQGLVILKQNGKLCKNL